MEKIEKLITQDDEEKSIYSEAYICGVYDGKISENDEMYQTILNLLKKRCEKDNVIDNNEDSLTVNEIFKTILDKVKEENNIDISFSDIDNFEDDFISNINNVINLPADKRILAIDSIVNMDIMHNPTMSIMEEIREYIGFKLNDLAKDLSLLYAIEEIEAEQNKMEFDPFAEAEQSEKDDSSNQNEPSYKDDLEFFKLLPKFSEMFKVRNKYIDQVWEMRSNYLIDEIKSQSPEYIEQLESLIDHPKDKITYYYHGAPSKDIAAKILNDGLFMQYGEIDRTAKKELSLSEILTYSYGHDNVGRRAIVVIAKPNGEYIVNFNNDTSVEIGGTAQGLEQGSFNPKYVIPSKYIVGYIDKYNKEFISNPNYIEKSEGKKFETNDKDEER